MCQNMVSLTHPSLKILSKTQVGVFSISRFLANPLYKNCHKPRTSDDIDISNLDQQLNLTRGTKQYQKNLMMMLRQQIMISLSFLQFLVNLEQSRSRIPDTQSAKRTF